MPGLNYFFHANVYLVIFYLFYVALLKNETYFKLNRLYLLCAVAVSFVIPYLRLEWIGIQAVRGAINMDIMVVLSADSAAEPGIFNWQDGVVAVYFGGALVAAVLLVFKLWRMKYVLAHPVKGVAFSFFNHKVIDTQLPGYAVINKHEEAHIKQLHSLDIILFELAGVFAWFNPVIYLYKSSIKEVHEYLADEEAVKYEGNKKQYALLLLSTAMGIMPAIGNSFIKQSLTKKRIFMLQKERSGKRSLFKYTLFVPLLAAVVLFSSATVKREGTSLSFSTTDTPPSFPGGYDKFREYLRSSTKYPVQASKHKVEGKVNIGFEMDETGKITQVKVVKGPGYGLNEEALRLIANSPRWNPGLINGEPVRVAFSINVNFVLKP